jgi:uncharacterized protein (TIGR02268 family)
MSPRLPILLSWILFLVSAPRESRAAPERVISTDERHIELTADSSRQDWAVRISPQQASNLMFNAPLRNGSVMVQERELFHSVMVDERAGLITLLPSAVMPPGKTLLLAVGFADNGVPENTLFRLVVQSGHAERQVRVDRKPRTAASFQEEAQQERERAERCESKRHIQTAPRCQEDLVGLFDAGLVKKGVGIRALDFLSHLPRAPTEGLSVKEAYGYRAIGRIAVELWLDESNQQPWQTSSAELLTVQGFPLKVLRTWQSPGQLHDGDLRQIVVEAEAPEPTAQGPFLLRLMEAEGPRTVTVSGVLFP